MTNQSEWQSPAAVTRSRTWPGPGSGTSTSTTSGPLPTVRYCTARIPIAPSPRTLAVTGRAAWRATASGAGRGSPPRSALYRDKAPAPYRDKSPELEGVPGAAGQLDPHRLRLGVL